jgi:NAD(P)-dependent dehydrogenase (short-subunit alcohol dehydrogenase family)
MHRIAQETVDRAGIPTHVVASIGGWYGGQPVWQTDEHAWNTYFVDPSRAHFAAARAFIPRMTDGGSYTMILGLSAYLALPATSRRAMHGGALRMLRQTLSTEVGQHRVLHVAARITHGARYLHLRIDRAWRWAVQIAAGFHRLRTAFT